MQAYDEVELGKVLRPMGLSTSEDFCGREVLEVFMICKHVNRNTRTFEVVSPDKESLEDCQQFFIVGIVVEFWQGECMRVESHRVDFTRIKL